MRRLATATLLALLVLAPLARAQEDRHDDDHAAAVAGSHGAGDGDAALRHTTGHGETHDPVSHLEAELDPATAARVRAAVGFARRHLATSAVDRNLRAATLLLEGVGGGHHPAEAQLLAALVEGAPAEAVRTRFGVEVADALARPSPARRVAAAVEALRSGGLLPVAERTRLLDRTGETLAELRRAGDPALARAVERELDRATVALAGPEASVERKVAELLGLARAKLPPGEVVRLASAVEVAKVAHAGQSRDGGEPALLHSLRVAAGLLARPGAVEAAAVHAAVLHDVVEDTRTPLSELRARFGPRVAELVNDVTLDPLEAFGNDKAARDKAYYERFARSSPSAHLIKLLDRIDNVNDMRGWPAEGKLGYLKRTRETVLASIERDPRLAAELLSEVERLEARARAEAGQGHGLGPSVSSLARYRRADGTLRWKELAADRARHEGRALGQFGLSLFLKELAVVVRTGDRLRIEEFFDGLLSTDFYVHYGVFSLGARAGEVAFARSLERVLRPRFVASLLKSNVALATGLLAGELAAGTLSGEHFAISLASLGLSTTAVRAGVLGLTWVRDLAHARKAALVGTSRRLLTAGRLAAATGWIYAIAETTVVLYVSEALEERLHAWRDAAAARAKLVAACKALLDAATRRGRGQTVDLDAALVAHAEAWTGWRDHLLSPLAAEDARLRARLEGFARRAKVLADERAAATAGLEAQPALAARLVARHGSLEAWATARAAEDEAALQRDVDLALQAYARARDEVLRAAYAAPRRGTPLFAGPAFDQRGALEWVARGGVAGDAGDPWRGRGDPLAGWGRRAARGAFDAALGRASTNRLEAYGDERAVLELAARLLGRHAEPARAAAALAARAEGIDARAVGFGDGSPTRGLTGAVEGR